MGLHLNVAADPTNFQVLECVQAGNVDETNGTVRRVLNVFHFGRASGSAPPVMATLAGNVRTALNTALKSCLNEAYIAEGSYWRPLDNPFVPPSSQSSLWDNGTQSGDRSSTVDAFTMNIGTGVRGRCFQGRKHFTPLTESNTDGDEIDAAALATYEAGAAALQGLLGVADGAGGTWNLAVFSRQSSVLGGPAITLTWADMVSVTLQPTLGTMRRRKQRAV